MEGLLGLTKSINDRDSAIRDLSVLERMDSRIQKDRDAEVKAQQQEQLFYERMHATADQLLEKDRNKINKKVFAAQKQLKDHLGKMGGSRKRFMEQGGMSFMNSLSNDIIRSEEVVMYQENKENLAKILEAKEKGLGHLLTPSDLKSLEEYEKNPNGGRISYNGIMNEVEIPPSANFDYGTDIPIEKILSHKSNALKIRQNYAINYPDRPEPNYLELIDFAKRMGYGGTGSNTLRLREQMAAAKKRATFDKKTSTKKEDHKNSYLNQLNVLKANDALKGITIKDINEKYNGDVLGALKETNPSIGKLVSNKFNHMSRQRNLSEKGLDVTDFRLPGRGNKTTPIEWAFNEKMGLKGAYEILPFNKYQVAERAFEEQFEVKDGKILNFTPTNDMYRMDGVKLEGDNELDPDDHTGNYKVLGVSTAWKAPMANDDNRDALLINAYDDDGDLDEKATKEINDAYGNSQAALTTVVALENENGDIFYKEIDVSQPQIKTLFSNELAEDDDITETVEQENRSAQVIENISKNTKEEQIAFQGAINTMEEKVFNDPIFKGEGEKYWGAQSGGQENRYPLMKSFYMAFDFINNAYKRDEENPNGDPAVYPSTTKSLIDNEIFTTAAINGDIEEDLKSYEQGNSEEQMISKWLQNINLDLEEGSLGYKKNQELASKWLQLLKML